MLNGGERRPKPKECKIQHKNYIYIHTYIYK